MRGEHAMMRRASCRGIGSAPHARGTRIVSRPDRHSIRFSPACAGNTSTAGCLAPPWPVQPRMRGEHAASVFRPLDPDGSAPHALGTLLVLKNHYPTRRFSPACAGNTVVGWIARPFYTVQPRMRGEHVHSMGACKRWSGSAPHARGTQLQRGYGGRLHRFSPACAGNT